jgi:alpha-tubulin suppressor-like RCC1 family protein
MLGMSRIGRSVLRASEAAALCAALITNMAIAAPPKLQSLSVTPSSSSISVGQMQYFTAKGTFSNGSIHALGPAITDIAPGEDGTCVLLASGGVKCWGYNAYGQIGDGTTTDSISPRPVKWITRATELDFAYYHGCALVAHGAIQCWGDNSYGQLGSGTYGGFSTRPVTVTGITSATALGLGATHGCALLSSGAVQCWGYGSNGELGDGTTEYTSVPVPVTGISTATAVAAGEHHSCAVLASGEVQCWGYNYYGQLGDGAAPVNASTPVTVIGINNATAVAAGELFSCALLDSGGVKCWGMNTVGELGDGTDKWNSSTPVSVVGISTAVAITAGWAHACVVLSSGAAKCWGYNNGGQLGNGLTTAWYSNTPVRVSEISAPVKLVAGSWHTCALLSDGAMRCWGENLYGELGNRRWANTPTRWPVNVTGTPGVVWQSSDPTKATITDGGRVTGRAVGNTTITATTAGFINDNVVLTVK